jgi:hypothetical protein
LNIIDKLESDHYFEYAALTVLTILSFKRIQRIEKKRASLRKKIKEKKHQV